MRNRESFRLLFCEPLAVTELGPADFDSDCDVDLNDYVHWLNCVTGPDGGPLANGCDVFDFDVDNDVDLVDFAGSQAEFGGG